MPDSGKITQFEGKANGQKSALGPGACCDKQKQ